MLIAAVAVGVHAIKRTRAAGDKYGEAISIGALGVLVTFMFHNLFEDLHVLNLGIHWGAALSAVHIGRTEARAPQPARFPVLQPEKEYKWKSW